MRRPHKLQVLQPNNHELLSEYNCKVTHTKVRVLSMLCQHFELVKNLPYNSYICLYLCYYLLILVIARSPLEVEPSISHLQTASHSLLTADSCVQGFYSWHATNIF